MPATKTQLIGGKFQDAEGNPLAGGYLTLKLNQDENVSGVGNVCAGVEITINLNSSGDVVVSPAQFVWATDVLLPINAYYRVKGYAANGQIAFGPNNQQVVSGGVGGGTFDLGTWVPNSVFSWSPSIQSLELQTNEVANGSQSLLDLHAGSGITLADNGTGRVTISNTASGVLLKTNHVSNSNQALLDLTAGTGVTLAEAAGVVTISAPGAGVGAGSPVAKVPWGTQVTAGPNAISTAGFNWVHVQFANSIVSLPSKWTVTLNVNVGLSAPVGEFVLIRTLKDSLTTVDITPIKFGGSYTPAFNTTGPQVSDTVNLQISAAHDHYFCFQGNPFGGSGQLLAQSTLITDGTSWAGNPNTGAVALSSLWASSIGAGGGWSGAFPIGPGVQFLTGWVAA